MEAIPAGAAPERTESEHSHNHVDDVERVRWPRIVPTATGAKWLFEGRLFFFFRAFCCRLVYVFKLGFVFVLGLSFPIFRHSSTRDSLLRQDLPSIAGIHSSVMVAFGTWFT